MFRRPRDGSCAPCAIDQDASPSISRAAVAVFPRPFRSMPGSIKHQPVFVHSSLCRSCGGHGIGFTPADWDPVLVWVFVFQGQPPRETKL